jgi:hypothetical protein
MRRILFAILVACLATSVSATGSDIEPALTADQIVAKNVAARGGLEAWRKVQTMAWLGHIQSANVPGADLPFILEMKRPDKTRFEIHAQAQKSVRMYDGTQGWKLRPTRTGFPDLRPYTADELNFAHDAQGISGPLMDYQANGIRVALEGVDEIEGNKAYRLNVKLPSGSSHHVWIDAQTFLDVKSDREARNAFGMSGMVSVYYRNYQTVDGLQIPFAIESRGADFTKTPDMMVIDKVALNPPLEDWMFAKPNVPSRHKKAIAVSVDSPQAVRQASWPSTSFTPGNFKRSNPGSVPGAGNAQ